MCCRICAGTTEAFASATILGNHAATYAVCRSCGFIQMPEHPWLDEAYCSAITSSDVGILQRNISNAALTAGLLSLYFPAHGKYLDYGGGYGIFVRLMRDHGFDFYRHDRYCENLFAGAFEGSPDTGYDLVTAFEVVEHLVSPLDDIRRMKEAGRDILISTELVPNPVPRPEEWHYYGLEHGQHISFFSRRSLEVVAEALGLHLASTGYFHLFTEKRIPEGLLRVLSLRPVSHLVKRLLGPQSRTQQDYDLMRQSVVTPASRNTEGITR